LYLDEKSISILKSLSVDSCPHVSQSALVEHLLKSTQEEKFEQEIKTNIKKRSKKTSKEVN